MLPLLKQILQDCEPILKPLYFIGSWLLFLMLISNIFRAIADTISRAKKMHQIPCSKCKYFTNNYRLKCTIKPNLANTEAAISCPDYCQKVSY